MRVLFSALNASALRNFTSVVALLAERGNEVVLTLHDGRVSAGSGDVLESLRRLPRVTLEPAPDLAEDARRLELASDLRASLDYLHFLEPRFNASYLARAARRAPRKTTRLAHAPVLRTRAGRAALRRLLATADALLRPSPALVRFVRSVGPDVVLLAPYVGLRTVQPDVLRAARSLGVPTGVCVASWDNLTSKSVMRPKPDRVFVWNETQRTEAVSLHGVPAERVVVTGAQCYDEWLTWAPRPRREFCERVGLDPARPYVLYTCFTPFKGDPPEVEFVLRWIEALRADPSPDVAAAGVLVRPHPKRSAEWQPVDVSRWNNVAVWPRDGRWPTEAAAKADYFDSIHHSAAVVGLNTSALLEAGLLGRPVLTILAPEFRGSQVETLHFRYLLEVGGGLVRPAAGLPEHVAALRSVLAGDDGAAAETFVRDFLRPFGADVPATPIFVDAVEALGRRRTVR